MSPHTRIRPRAGTDAGVGDADAAIVRMEKLRCSRLQTKLDAHLAAIKKSYGWRVLDIDKGLRGLLTSLRYWCAAHGSEMCDGRKSAEFPAGAVRWKRRPPRIKVWDETSAVRALRKAGMESFLRSRMYVSRGAILRDRDTAIDLRGVEVGSTGEGFVVCPFGARLGGRHVEWQHCPHCKRLRFLVHSCVREAVRRHMSRGCRETGAG